MRLLFLVPPAAYNEQRSPIDRVYGCNYGYDYKAPIHHLLFATWAHQLGCEVEFLDCPARGWGARRFERWLDQHPFDAVVQHSVYLSIEEDLRAARQVRTTPWGSAAHLLFWGTGAAWKPALFGLDQRSWVFMGEPEATFEAWLGCIQQGRSPLGEAGLTGFDSDLSPVTGGARPLIDVERLPIPERRWLAGGRYRLNRLNVHPSTVAVFSRGCGYRCTFCTPAAIDQAIELEFKKPQSWYKKRPPLRLRSTAQVIQEFHQIAALGYRAIEVSDNLFTWNGERIREICDAIEPLQLHWTCLGRADQLRDPMVAQALARGGCKMVYMGTEAFDNKSLKEMRKGMRAGAIREAVENLRNAGVEPEVSVLMGAVEGETRASIRRTIDAARSLGTRFVHYSVALPTPSTELYDIARQKGWFVDGDFTPIDNAKDAIVNLPGISAEELRREVKRAYLQQYLSPAGIRAQLARVRSPADLVHKVRSGLRLIRFSLTEKVRPGLSV